MTDPAGAISLPRESAQLLLADSDEFRSWTGTESQAHALGRILGSSAPPPADGAEFTLLALQQMRPYARIWTDEEGGFSHPRGMPATGMLGVRFVENVASAIAGDPDEIELRFENRLGTIRDEMMDLSVAGGYLFCQDIYPVGPIARGHPDVQDSQGDFLFQDWVIEWGLGG